MDDNSFYTSHVAIQIVTKDKKVHCGAAVLSRKARTSMEEHPRTPWRCLTF